LNTWTHLAVTYDGFSLKLYINGTLAATRTVRGPIAASTDALHIGGTSALSAWFSGLIDEVRIYNRALAPAAIVADMTTPVG
jgi:hypothetical protein